MIGAGISAPRGSTRLRSTSSAGTPGRQQSRARLSRLRTAPTGITEPGTT
ncbi:hypothetical protein ACIG0C_35340 [Kitasatospora aureofaciens]|nr:hypothetical protein [Kitasatospora aureofaciens]